MVKATFEFVGLTEYLKKLDTLGVKSTGCGWQGYA